MLRCGLEYECDRAGSCMIHSPTRLWKLQRTILLYFTTFTLSGKLFPKVGNAFSLTTLGTLWRQFVHFEHCSEWTAQWFGALATKVKAEYSMQVWDLLTSHTKPPFKDTIWHTLGKPYPMMLQWKAAFGGARPWWSWGGGGWGCARSLHFCKIKAKTDQLKVQPGEIENIINIAVYWKDF